jgi:hypothetical protein
MGLTNQHTTINLGDDKKSLNKDLRKRELLRVTLENYVNNTDQILIFNLLGIFEKA